MEDMYFLQSYYRIQIIEMYVIIAFLKCLFVFISIYYKFS
jgi:hypothetical protein